MLKALALQTILSKLQGILMMIMMRMIVIIFIIIIIFSNIISIINFNKYKVSHYPQLPLFNTSHTFWQSNMAHLYQSPQMKFKSFKLRIG